MLPSRGSMQATTRPSPPCGVPQKQSWEVILGVCTNMSPGIFWAVSVRIVDSAGTRETSLSYFLSLGFLQKRKERKENQSVFFGKLNDVSGLRDTDILGLMLP